ncbi:MAG: hypothetical protein FH758_06060 [Firmicutes bacterium]|nr:hypothetical protein [Bacillota bacterium]
MKLLESDERKVPMRYLENCLHKTMFVIIIGILCMILCGTFVGMFAEANSNAGGVSMDAVLQNDNIVVSVTPEVKANKVRNGNNGNTMNKTQIWGNYGRGWFLIKDYGNYKGKKNSGNQQFIWDLKSLDTKNESYWGQSSYRFTNEDTDMFKIYVRHKKNYSQHGKKSVVDLYKTFYLGSPKQDVQLITDREKEEYALASYDFPVVARQNNKVELYLSAAGVPDGYDVKIKGDNYTQHATKKTDEVFEWVPEESGTFYIIVYDSQSQVVLKRKVYVNSLNNEYLQLGDLTINNKNNIVCVMLEVEDTRPTGFNENIGESLRFVISEPHVWSKTIKDYGDTITYNSESGTYEINEEHEGFKFGSGNYSVGASIKTPHSIETDDRIAKSYRQSVVDNVYFEVDWECINGKPRKDGSYSLKQKSPLQFHFQVKEPQENYEYAFLLHDARGKRLVKAYSQSTGFSWSPADPGEYTIYARARLKQRMGTLPNSYEKELAIPIRIAHPAQDVTLERVRINGNEWRIDNGQATLVAGDGSIPSHTLNVIEVGAETKGNMEKNHLMYKVYGANKGYKSSLNDYTFSNHIPFYPKSTGEYSLVVMVKDSISGSHEDRCEILVNVK